ncbi:aldo/keto reductase [Sandaracinobacter sp. RS1-74]|uniref:aldo/keto reductase n=1 Tax=Sandaracinobacteroides sayramensis TaxID=2913411 RepID=UPI001EDC53EF|nr:aldo/keto reductase [Sandaracinobacteroides sayramensis]MCG2840959.1 aldo/keto reductase [Sandaracinobacteroides sayramensis]
MPLDHYVTLGASGLKVSRLCLGAMTFGTEWGFGADAADSTAMLEAYVDRGGNFVDTANIYTGGSSETIIGDWLAAEPSRRDRLVVATKFSGNMQAGNPNGGGASRSAIIAACDASLRRLRTDHIDLYWQHWADPFTPVEETMATLDDLVRAGKVRYIGFSDTPAWQVAQAQTIARLRGNAPLIALQIEYSLLERTVEGELVPMAQAMGLGITPWSPLRSGLLSGKYDRHRPQAESAGRTNSLNRHFSDHAFDVVDLVREIASGYGATPACVALAWLLARPGVASPIVGARTPGQLEANLAALDLVLDPADIARLDAATRPRLNFPAEFLPMSVANSYSGMTINGQAFQRSPR